ncbi:hypothetical protein JYU34_004506 [Plutella xylostella]|uniref:Uncharacterized protein n=1 Tax=Plutella xylostella TaxID=51655 RepID=A0ABQ7QY56_PLUXY|nr:hypothetical protein JYU34_004506 [Plutella xylostella]
MDGKPPPSLIAGILHFSGSKTSQRREAAAATDHVLRASDPEAGAGVREGRICGQG